MNEWLALALSPPVRKRAVKVAVLVGSILAVINYSDKIIAGTFQTRDLVKLLMTFIVPYCVSTYSAVSALREAARNSKA
ncbi:MAG: nitrate/nitrite transporter NrtS [Hyphomicrobiales bacterium]|nr:nitrate/nitrite transporter NrtS [Hyphomicrobiales bacterium]